MWSTQKDGEKDALYMHQVGRFDRQTIPDYEFFLSGHCVMSRDNKNTHKALFELLLFIAQLIRPTCYQFSLLRCNLQPFGTCLSCGLWGQGRCLGFKQLLLG